MPKRNERVKQLEEEVGILLDNVWVATQTLKGSLGKPGAGNMVLAVLDGLHTAYNRMVQVLKGELASTAAKPTRRGRKAASNGEANYATVEETHHANG